MRVLVLLVVVIVVTWESKANSSSTGNELQTGTELGNIWFRNRQVYIHTDLKWS